MHEQHFANEETLHGRVVKKLSEARYDQEDNDAKHTVRSYLS